MSLQTWRAEFYPTEANECPADEAIEHSLRKWRGLRAEPLTRHGVSVDGACNLSDAEDNCFRIGSESCALCERFYYDDDSDTPVCSRCPLAISRGGVPCDNEAPGEGKFSPWAHWCYNKDPEPMIAALEKALQDKKNGGAS